jgi:hypothetical protein
VTDGRYRGAGGQIGNDGLWRLADGRTIIIEVKTTDAFRIDLNRIAAYRKELSKSGSIVEDESSILIVVGRSDTGDLEAQIRGSRYAWDMRVISVDAFVRLMLVKEEVEDPETLKRMHELLIPREFTKLDEIVDIVFSTAEEAKQVETVEVAEPGDTENRTPKFHPVAFHDACVTRISKYLNRTLLKRSRATFTSPDGVFVLICAVSKLHEDTKHPNYWFAFHPHQKDTLAGGSEAYMAFGCGSPETVLLIPFRDFEKWIEGMNITQREDRFYWHVQIFGGSEGYTLVRRKGQPRIPLNEYLLLNR